MRRRHRADRVRRQEGQAQAGRGVLAPVRHDGELGAADRRALAILADQTDNKELARVLGEARLDVEQGSSLSGALGKHDHVFNNLYISMVRAGETGGSLDSTLLRVAEMIEKEVQLRGKIKSAMTYRSRWSPSSS